VSRANDLYPFRDGGSEHIGSASALAIRVIRTGGLYVRDYETNRAEETDPVRVTTHPNVSWTCPGLGFALRAVHASHHSARSESQSDVVWTGPDGDVDFRLTCAVLVEAGQEAETVSRAPLPRRQFHGPPAATAA